MDNGNTSTDVFIETEPYEKGFAAFFAEQLLPLKAPLEEQRNQLFEQYTARKRLFFGLKWFAIVTAIAGIVITFTGSIGICFAGMCLPYKFIIFIILLYPFILFGTFFWAEYPKLTYMEHTKKITEKVLQFFFHHSMKYQPNGNRHFLQRMNDLQFLPFFNRSHTEDYVKTKIHEQECEIMEVTLRIKSDERAAYKKFKGIVVHIPFAFPLQGGFWLLEKRTWEHILHANPTDSKEVPISDPTLREFFTLYAKEGTTSFPTVLIDKIKQAMVYYPATKDTGSFSLTIQNNAISFILPLSKNILEIENMSLSPLDTDVLKAMLSDIAKVCAVTRVFLPIPSSY